MKPVKSRNASQEESLTDPSRNASQDESNESPKDPMSKLRNQYSQVMERLGGPENAVNLLRHQRRCKICRHSDRAAIEHEFLEWRSPSEIAIDYDIPNRATVYRHAHATRLFLRRRRTFRGALERIMERAEEADVSAASVVLAVRAYARINDDGQWIEPPQIVQVVHTVTPAPAPAPSPSASPSSAPPATPLLTQDTAPEGSVADPSPAENPHSRQNPNRNTKRYRGALSD